MSVLQRITGRKKRDDLLTAQMEDRWNQGTMNLLNGGFGNISFGKSTPDILAILSSY